jgi:hypothetical protein
MGRLVDWLFCRDPPREPAPDASVEIAWLPLWQAHLVLHELWEQDVPTVLAEDHTSHLRFASFEPMARLFVLGHRAARARQIVEDVLGAPPITQHR